jgi:hypothetical protein
VSKTDLREFEVLTENEELRRQITELQVRLRQTQTKTADLVQAAHDGAKAAAIVLGNPPAVPVSKADGRKKQVEAALLHLSDWQIGKATGTYDSEIAKQRIKLLGEKLTKLVGIERADHPVTECHNLLGGDLVEGVTIFPGQTYEIDSGLFKQTFTAVGAIEQLIRQELATFEKVHCWEVEGNHGRLGRKGDLPREDNTDLFVYREARERLAEYEQEGRLVWHPRKRWYAIIEIGNYRALLVHGDQVKQFGGNTPAFGIVRKVNAWASGVLPAFTDVYMGHFHQPLVLPMANGRGRTFVNPSLESDSAYAQEFMSATGTPGQRLHFVDPESGRVTSERLIWLDEA